MSNPSHSGAEPAAPPKEITNSIGMKLVLIPAGKFLMGSPKDEKERDTDEEQHEVSITKPFYLGVYEVTQTEYEKVMGNNPSYFSPKGDGEDSVKDMETGQFPVERVPGTMPWLSARSYRSYRRRRRRGRFIDCRPRPSGNMPAGPEPRRLSTTAIPCRPSKPTLTVTSRMEEAIRGRILRKRQRLARMLPMLSACTTCMVMCGSGARTGMMRTTTRTVPGKILRGLRRPRSGSFAAGAGSSTAGTAVPPSASGTIPAAGSATWASAWPQFSPDAEPSREVARAEPVA